MAKIAQVTGDPRRDLSEELVEKVAGRLHPSKLPLLRGEEETGGEDQAALLGDSLPLGLRL